MLFTFMAALAQMELDIKRERIAVSVSKRRGPAATWAAGRRRSLHCQIRNALRVVDCGEPTAQVLHDLGMSPSTFYRRARALDS